MSQELRIAKDVLQWLMVQAAAVHGFEPRNLVAGQGTVELQVEVQALEVQHAGEHPFDVQARLFESEGSQVRGG